MRSFALSLLLCCTVQLHAMDPAVASALTVQAEQAYANGDHGAALQLFDSVYQHYTSPSLLYNIGNCHYKLQDHPRAILFYERALLLAPGDADVQANLDLARQQIVDRVNEMPRSSVINALDRFTGGHGSDRWASIAIWAWVLAAITIAAAFLARRTMLRRTLQVLGSLSALFAIIAVMFAALGHPSVRDENGAIIMAARTDVYSEPQQGGTVLFILHKGTKVFVLQQDQEWYEIELLNGNVGWIPEGTLEMIHTGRSEDEDPDRPVITIKATDLHGSQ